MESIFHNLQTYHYFPRPLTPPDIISYSFPIGSPETLKNRSHDAAEVRDLQSPGYKTAECKGINVKQIIKQYQKDNERVQTYKHIKWWQNLYWCLQCYEVRLFFYHSLRHHSRHTDHQGTTTQPQLKVGTSSSAIKSIYSNFGLLTIPLTVSSHSDPFILFSIILSQGVICWDDRTYVGDTFCTA